MDVLKQQLARIQQQLLALTPSQRMLAAALVTLMVITILYWSHYAASSDLVAVVDRPLSAEKTQQLVGALKTMGITASTSSDGKVMVPADRRFDALGAAMQTNAASSTDIAETVKQISSQMSIFDPNEKTQAYNNQIKEAMLSQMIGMLDGVQFAKVMIDRTAQRQIGGNVHPTASIWITMKDDAKLSRKQVMGAADVVVGAQAGMLRSYVNVVVNGLSYPLPDREQDEGGAGNILEMKSGWENLYLAKVETQLAHIPGTLVMVNVEVENKRVEQEKSEVDPKNVIQKEKELTNRTGESTEPPPTSGEPGSVPNAGVGLQGVPSSGGSTTSNDEHTSFEVDWGKTRTLTKTPPGTGTLTSVTVRVPRSYFVRAAKVMNSNKDPDDTMIARIMTDETDKIRKAVLGATGIANASAVYVTDYFDEVIPPPDPGSRGVPVLAMVTGYGREIGLGVLALTAMLMVSGIVKKSTTGVPAMLAQSAAEQQRELERLIASEEVVGAAVEGTPALEGVELDEETGKTQQMVTQVSNMVKENPDAATALIKRWMNRS